MKIRDYSLKIWISCAILSCLFSSVFAATTKKWREIVNQLEDDWRPDNEIKVAIEDLWYIAEDYLWKNINSKLTVFRDSDSWIKSSSLSAQWQSILKQLIENWRTDEEIKQAIKDLGYDPNLYFSNWSAYEWIYESSFTARSCKSYRIEYVELLDAYTSPDLQKKEYFVTPEYLKRYINSKNKPQANCPTTAWSSLSPYYDKDYYSDRFVAPNGKVYFIIYQDWYYSSSELTNSKRFWSLSEIKYYIRDHNPLIWMNI